MKIVITSNPYRDRNLMHAVEARDILTGAGAEAKICLAFDVDPAVRIPDSVSVYPLEKELKDADVLVCFGGDGTLLHASKAATRLNIPVLGINIGTVGFMADLEVSELSKITALVSGDYKVEKRMMIDVTVLREGKEQFSEIGLNDASITKGAVARVIQLDVSRNDEPAMSFGGDGLIIATPTGSTGYSLSAGGPVFEPCAHSMIVTPICAHSLTAKPFATSAEGVIEVSVGRIGRKNAYLSVDGGKAFRLNAGDRIQVRRSDYETGLIRISGKGFFEILRTKLK